MFLQLVVAMSPSVIRTESDQSVSSSFRRLDLTFDSANSEASARQLIFSLNPEWEFTDGPVEFERFKDGITNTVGLAHDLSLDTFPQAPTPCLEICVLIT